MHVGAVEAGSEVLVGGTHARAVPRVHGGQCAVTEDDGVHREEVALRPLRVGLYLPPMVWATQRKLCAAGALLALASAEYDSAEYIRADDVYLALARR